MGVLNMSVRAAGGVATRIKRPTMVSCTPNNGDAAGGTAIAIAGTNFKPGTTFTLGGVACTSVVITGKTTATAVTGAHAAGAVAGLATIHDGNEQTSPSAAAIYTYT